MRRRDREVTEQKHIDEIIAACDCCRLGMRDEAGVYIVPMNFGFRRENDRRYLYFHGADEGKKLDLLRKNPQVGFEMDTAHDLVAAESAEGFSFRYSCIVGKGIVRFLQNPAEKRRALSFLMEHYTKKTDWSFPEKLLEHMAVLELEVTEISAKEH